MNRKVTIENIRLAVPGDAAEIAGLIKELAEFEKLADEAAPDEARLAVLIQSFDPCVPEAIIFVVESEGRLIGFALCCNKYSTFLTEYFVYLEDLFVKPEYRGQGIGTMLIEVVARYAAGTGSKRLDLEVLEWNPAVGLYEKLGFAKKAGWIPMRLEGRALLELPGKLMAQRMAKQ